jgi:hypothetical protein
MAGPCRSLEHVRSFKTDHSIGQYTLLDATFGILEPIPVVERSVKGKLYIPLTTDIRYFERMKGVCYGPQHWHLGFVNIKKGESSAHHPPTVLNPGEANREQEGDQPHCPDS